MRACSRPLVDPFAEKIDELVDRSRAQIRAERRTESWWRWAMRGRIARRGGRSRTPNAGGGSGMGGGRGRGILQPGLWLQWDYGDGPEVAGTRAVLFCAWLAWSRFRVVVPSRDKTLASVVIGLDRTLGSWARFRPTR